MHFNIQSINNKKDELKHFIATEYIDICSINETWLNNSQSISINPTMPSFARTELGRKVGESVSFSRTHITNKALKELPHEYQALAEIFNASLKLAYIPDS